MKADRDKVDKITLSVRSSSSHLTSPLCSNRSGRHVSKYGVIAVIKQRPRRPHYCGKKKKIFRVNLNLSRNQGLLKTCRVGKKKISNVALILICAALKARRRSGDIMYVLLRPIQLRNKRKEKRKERPTFSAMSFK